jgi:branched-chain amino acid transport system ATP-binding protein
VLETQGVSKAYYGVLAVIDMSLQVYRGETLAIIGPNGAGKSTYFGLMAGEHMCSSGGKILFNGTDITRWPPHRRTQAGISRTFQVARLFPSRTVGECVAISAAAKRRGYTSPFRSFHRSSRSDRELTERVIDRLGLAPFSRTLAGNLAQGDRKRLELGMALVQQPSLLLLDEPTAGMTTEDCLMTIRMLKAVQESDRDLTIVMTGHDMDVLFALAKRVVLMNEGQKVMDATPEEVGASELARKVYLGGGHAGLRP